MISLGASSGGALTSMWTWSPLTTPLTILISKASHVCITNSLTLIATSPVKTPYRYFATNTKWHSIL